METLFAVIIVALVLVLSWFFFPRHRKLPPGPYPLPIIGNILQLGQNPHRSLTELTKTYGPLMSLQLGTLYTIVVSSPEIAKEILQKHDQVFSSRTITVASEAHDHSKLSMAYLPVGKEWQKLRKLAREQMFTNLRLEASKAIRKDKLQKLCGYLRDCSSSRKAVDIGEAAFITTFNLMSATLFSTEVTSFDSDTTQEFRETFESLAKIVGLPNVADFFPVLKPFDPQGIKRKSKFYFGKLLGFIEDLINQRITEYGIVSHEGKKTDLLEALLDLRQGSDHELSIEVIKHLLLDFFVAGSTTTTSTVEWAMTELLLNPETLSKAKNELMTVVGRADNNDSHILDESDISRLPYLQAVIKETFRIHTPGPFLIPRKSECDVQLRGYDIPKGTQMLVNVWAIGRDPAIWPDPDSFKPERFLDTKSSGIDFKGQDFELIPFGSGRRICPAMPLVNRMLHITVATLVHNFDWKLVEEIAEDHNKELFGLSLRRAVPLKLIPIKPSL